MFDPKAAALAVIDEAFKDYHGPIRREWKRVLERAIEVYEEGQPSEIPSNAEAIIREFLGKHNAHLELGGANWHDFYTHLDSYFHQPLPRMWRETNDSTGKTP